MWSPRDNQVYLANEFVPIWQADGDNKEKLTYRALAAKVAHTIANRDAMLAPLESNIEPLPHQFYTLDRVLSRDNIRYLLADELGLGKTIEAGLNYPRT